MKTKIFIKTQFEGFHCWPDAPDEVSFLRSIHRHVFNIKAEKAVSHSDRDIEFILLKRKVDKEIESKLFFDKDKIATWSCEQWAQWLLNEFNFSRVEVSEDNENGAIVEA